MQISEAISHVFSERDGHCMTGRSLVVLVVCAAAVIGGALASAGPKAPTERDQSRKQPPVKVVAPTRAGVQYIGRVSKALAVEQTA